MPSLRLSLHASHVSTPISCFVLTSFLADLLSLWWSLLFHLGMPRGFCCTDISNCVLSAWTGTTGGIVRIVYIGLLWSLSGSLCYPVSAFVRLPNTAVTLFDISEHRSLSPRLPHPLRTMTVHFGTDISTSMTPRCIASTQRGYAVSVTVPSWRLASDSQNIYSISAPPSIARNATSTSFITIEATPSNRMQLRGMYGKRSAC